MRMGELRQRLDEDPGFIKQLASCLDQARSPKRLARCLGMAEHPALRCSKHAWAKIFREVIYHADGMTVHKAPWLELPVPPPAAGDAPAHQGQSDQRPRTPGRLAASI